METDSSFVRTYSIVVLDAVAPYWYAHFPDHLSRSPETRKSDREYRAARSNCFFQTRYSDYRYLDGIQYLFYCLVVFLVRWETAFSILSKRLLLS